MSAIIFYVIWDKNQTGAPERNCGAALGNGALLDLINSL